MSILAFSGRRRHGKNTGAGIAAYLLAQEKKTIADELSSVEMYVKHFEECSPENFEIHTGYRKKMFAGPLKHLVCQILNCTMEDLEDPEFKEKELDPKWNTHFVVVQEGSGEKKISPYYERIESAYAFFDANARMYGQQDKALAIRERRMTPRIMMKMIGDEGGRQLIHPRVWIYTMFSDIGDLSNIIITDCRYPEEYEEIYYHPRSCVIRMFRPGVDDDDDHTSETSLDHLNNPKNPNLVFNDGTIGDLVPKIKRIMIAEGFLSVTS